MKLLCRGLKGFEKSALVDRQGNFRDLPQVVPDIFGPILDGVTLARIDKLDVATLPVTAAGAHQSLHCAAWKV